jgi:aspartate/methionine/tyrosine aminotransferase
MGLIATTRFQSSRIVEFKESVIREMTRLAIQHGAVNLAQGFPDFPAPAEIKEAARQAISEDWNQYSITWGLKPFRDAIAEYHRHFHGITLDPERELTVCCGATEGMLAVMLSLLNEGDEVVVFEPFYENYWPDSKLCGADCKYVTLHPPDWKFDPEALRRKFSSRTRAVILNSPNNPTGKVFNRAELQQIVDLAEEFDAFIITDEIYEHVIFDGETHVPPMTLPGGRNRSVLINALSKSYSVTGWRIGWVAAAPELSASIRKLHDFATVNAPTPLQRAGITALAMPDSYYGELAAMYQGKRDLMVGILEGAGLRCSVPKGAYYIMADISDFDFPDDTAFCMHLVKEIGVSAVPGSSFFSRPEDGKHLVRFCFCKKQETLDAAGERLGRLKRG